MAAGETVGVDRTGEKRRKGKVEGGSEQDLQIQYLFTKDPAVSNLQLLSKLDVRGKGMQKERSLGTITLFLAYFCFKKSEN